MLCHDQSIQHIYYTTLSANRMAKIIVIHKNAHFTGMQPQLTIKKPKSNMKLIEFTSTFF